MNAKIRMMYRLLMNIEAAQGRISRAQDGIRKATDRITAAEAEIATLESEIAIADSAISLLQEGLEESRTRMRDLMEMVEEIDGAFHISMEGAKEAIIDYINAMRALMDSFDTKHPDAKNPLADFGIWNMPTEAKGLDALFGSNRNLDKILKEVFGEYTITIDQSLNNYYHNLQLLKSPEFQKILAEAMKDGLIIDQNSEAIQKFMFGFFTDVDNHCGWIALYNALVILGDKRSPADIIRAIESSGMLMGGAMLGGKLGTNPNAIRDYLNSLGFDASQNAPNNLDKTLTDGNIGILMYSHPDFFNDGAHYVTIEKDGDQYKIYNDSKASEPVTSVDEWLKLHNRDVISWTTVKR